MFINTMAVGPFEPFATCPTGEAAGVAKERNCKSLPHNGLLRCHNGVVDVAALLDSWVIGLRNAIVARM